MTDQTLNQLYAEHKGKMSDKWTSYLIEYDRIFGEYKDKPVNLLEIGVQNGGSLEIWSKYFINAQKLVGCDINPECARLVYEDSRIVVVVGDANSDMVELEVLQHAPVFQIMFDDGSHRSGDILKSFSRYFPHLADGGVYVAEDLHCSYWAEFEGGLFDPFSSIMFFKRLSDIVNHEHWGIDKSRCDILRGFFLKYNFQIDGELLKHIHSIQFINSICVIRKEAPQDNTLGSRFIAGIDGSIEPQILDLQSTSIPEPSQLANKWTARITPPDEDVVRLENEIRVFNNMNMERDAEIANLRQKIQEGDAEIANLRQKIPERDAKIANLRQKIQEGDGKVAEIYNSHSWRITKPLRSIHNNYVKILHKFGI